MTPTSTTSVADGAQMRRRRLARCAPLDQRLYQGLELFAVDAIAGVVGW